MLPHDSSEYEKEVIMLHKIGDKVEVTFHGTWTSGRIIAIAIVSGFPFYRVQYDTPLFSNSIAGLKIEDGAYRSYEMVPRRKPEEVIDG